MTVQADTLGGAVLTQHLRAQATVNHILLTVVHVLQVAIFSPRTRNAAARKLFFVVRVACAHVAVQDTTMLHFR